MKNYNVEFYAFHENLQGGTIGFLSKYTREDSIIYIGMYQGNLEMIFKSTKGVPFEKSEKYSRTIHLTI